MNIIIINIISHLCVEDTVLETQKSHRGGGPASHKSGSLRQKRGRVKYYKCKLHFIYNI